jgi:hypothetical protein
MAGEQALGTSTEPGPVEYRIVPNHPGYRAGSDGSIWSRWRQVGIPGAKGGARTVLCDRWRRLKGTMGRGGYLVLHVCGSRKLRKFHHLVLEAWVGPRPAGYVCRHLDGNPANNAPSNLRWGTPLENIADRQTHGTTARGDRSGSRLHPERVPRGERASKAKLSEQQVREIRRRARESDVTLTQLASEFGVYLNAIWMIVHRKSWKHVVD